jgi:nucleotide-binding universal stress UspA family protein
MKIEKILWPTDLSGSAEQALDSVKSLTIKYGAEIHVLYVVEDIAHHKSWYGDFKQKHIDQIIEWENNKAVDRLEHICSQYLDGCPLYIRHVAVGDPATEILKLIETESIDMVIMATKGSKGIFHFGSVTDKVVKNAPVPVLTIPVAKT